MLRMIRNVITLAIVFTGLLLLVGALSISPAKTALHSPYASSLSDVAIGTAVACPPSCTHTKVGPRGLQCISTTDCTNCVPGGDLFITVQCNGH